MRALPPVSCANGRSFTVADFYEAGREELSLELVAGGSNMERVIEEPIANRPGLALTGFYEHFAWKRLQVIGNAETAYLDSLAPAERRARLEALVDHKAFCCRCPNGRKPGPTEI